MAKKNLIILLASLAVLLIIAIAAGLFYFDWRKKTKDSAGIQDANQITNKALENATKGALPSINTNPLENKPDINPASAANPIKNIKTNPFE